MALSQLPQKDAIQTVQEILDDWLQNDTVSPRNIGIEALAAWIHTRQAELDEAASDHETHPSGSIRSEKEPSDADDNHSKAKADNEAGSLSNNHAEQSETPDRTRKALQSRASTRSTRVTRSMPDSQAQPHQDQPQSVSKTQRQQKAQHNRTAASEKGREQEQQDQLRREQEQTRAQKQQEQEQRQIQKRREQERQEEREQRRRQKENEQEERQAQKREKQEQLRIQKQQEQEDKRRHKEEERRQRQIEKEKELEEQRLQMERALEELQAQKQQREEQREEQEHDERKRQLSNEQKHELQNNSRGQADVPDMNTTSDSNDQSTAIRAAPSSETTADESASSGSGDSTLVSYSNPTGPQALSHQLLTPQTSTVASYATAGSSRSRAARTLAGIGGQSDTDPDQRMDMPAAPGPQKAFDLDAVLSSKSIHPPRPSPHAQTMSEASSADTAVPGKKSWFQKDLDDLDFQILRFTAESKFEPGLRETIGQILNLPNLKYTSERRRYMIDFIKSLFAPASYWDIRCTVHKLISKRGLRCGEPGMVGVHHSICDDADTPQSFKDFIDRWYTIVEFAQDTSSASMTRITRTTQEMLCYEQWRRIRQIWRGPECFGIDNDSDGNDEFDETGGWKQCGGSVRSQPPQCTPEEHQDLLAFLEKERQRRGTVYVGKKFMAKEARDVRGDSFLRIVLAPRLGLGAFGANGDAKAAGLALATEKSTQKMFDKLWNNTMTRGKAAFTVRKYLGWGALIIVKRSSICNLGTPLLARTLPYIARAHPSLLALFSTLQTLFLSPLLARQPLPILSATLFLRMENSARLQRLCARREDGLRELLGVGDVQEEDDGGVGGGVEGESCVGKEEVGEGVDEGASDNVFDSGNLLAGGFGASPVMESATDDGMGMEGGEGGRMMMTPPDSAVAKRKREGIEAEVEEGSPTKRRG
ncbi:MAG: hypothetical protein LQ350_008060 [Teloschistes chrysophthalmus]|nr:MAG: hypothetical protein LQ350_008060 [Niorma chrysophthalma]